MFAPLRERCILHVDIDAFLASVEQVTNPALRDRAVIVGGLPHERNLVMSCSYEARAHGIHPGMFLPVAARIARRKGLDAVFLHGSSERANQVRERLLELLRRYTPQVEATSLDDAYADLTGTARWHAASQQLEQPLAIATSIARDVRRQIGLSISQGLGSNRLVARLATRLGKPGGLGYILPGHERAFVSALSIRALPGVGRRIGGFLENLNIRTAGELQRVPRELMIATFGTHGRKLYDRCRGIDHEAVRAGREASAIHRETTLETPSADRDEVRAMLCYLVDRASARLRSMGRAARTLGVRLHYVDRAEPEIRRTLDEPSQVTAVLQQQALELCERFLRRRVLIRLVGVTLRNLVPPPAWSPSLFESGEESRRELCKVMDRIRARHGFGRLVAGRAIELLGRLENQPGGFRLRTPSLVQ